MVNIESNVKIDWLKCHHGVEKRHHCQKCEDEKKALSDYLKQGMNHNANRIPIKRGCDVSGGACFCTGRCQEIVGWRDPLYPGEK